MLDNKETTLTPIQRYVLDKLYDLVLQDRDLQRFFTLSGSGVSFTLQTFEREMKFFQRDPVFRKHFSRSPLRNPVPPKAENSFLSLQQGEWVFTDE